MIEKDPLAYSILQYAWVFGLSSWGGLAHYIRKVKMGYSERFSIVELIGEITISAFAGIITFFLCEAAEAPKLITAAMIGVSGHMGSRTIFAIERLLQKKKIIPEEIPAPEEEKKRYSPEKDSKAEN